MNRLAFQFSQRFRQSLALAVCFTAWLGWQGSAHALCEESNDLTAVIAKHEPAANGQDADALRQASIELDQAISALPKRVDPECRGDRNTALRNAAALKEKIRKALTSLGNAKLAVSIDYAEDAEESDATVYLDGEQLTPTSQPAVIKGETYELRVQLESAVRRTFEVTVTLGSAELKKNRTEGDSLIYQVKLPPGEQSLSVLITGKRIPDAKVLDLSLAPEDKKGAIRVKLDEKIVPVGDAPIILDGTEEEHVLVFEHPARETSRGWFRVKLNRDHEPQQPTATDSKQTVYKFRAVEGKATKMDLSWQAGPKVHPWRENLIYAGLGIAALGVAGAVVFGLEALDLEEQWTELYEDNDCGTVDGCSEDTQEQVEEIFEEAESCYTWTNVSLIGVGTGLVLAGFSFFILESGEDPPDDMVRDGKRSPRYASRDGEIDLKLQPQVGTSLLGAQLSGTW
jgi:hypothetical protein